MKRIVDIVVGVVALACLLPVAVVLAIAILIISPGPPIRVTRRMGRYHYRFRIASRDNPHRLTSAGRVIGNMSLDEIPAIWNVVKGDLSLVGPRPPRYEEVDLRNPDWQFVLSVRPGLFSPSLLVLRERFNRTPVKERLEPDLEYVRRQTPLLDVRVFARTIFATLRSGHLKGRS